MDRQSVIGSLLLSLALGSGCFNVTTIEGRFDGPSGGAILHPGEGGPFTEPVAFVSNQRNGLLQTLDLKHGWMLTDDPAAPFLWGAALPTGAARILGDMEIYAPDRKSIQLFVADHAHEVLVEIPYVVGVEEGPSGEAMPVEAVTSLTQVVDRPADSEESQLLESSSDAWPFLDLNWFNRSTPQEIWTLTWTGSSWSLEGSRSGKQSREALPWVPYHTDHGELELTLTRGGQTPGDRLELHFDRGVTEWDLGGVVQATHRLDDPDLLLASVYQREDGSTRLVALDLEARQVLGALPLPEDAVPWRMSSVGQRLLVADARSPRVYRVSVSAEDWTASEVSTLEVEAPVADLAVAHSEDYIHLFVASAWEGVVDVYDLETQRRIDVNPITPELDGIRVDSPITGLAATRVDSDLPETSTWGGALRDRVVAISTFSGEMLLAEGSTGCLVQDEVGPYTVLDADGHFTDRGASSTPLLEGSQTSSYDGVEINPCGGVARTEEWRAVYSQHQGAWVVEGSISGIQETLAYEDERYVSDEGAVSLLILSGTYPTTDGDEFRWTSYEGIVRVNGDLDGNGSVDQLLEIPARPLPYSYLSGPQGGGWDPVNRKVGLLWPITNGDKIVRVNAETAIIEQIWD